MSKRKRRPIRGQAQRRPSRRRAVILLIVLVAVAAISLGAYTFSDLMLTNHQATDLVGRQIQARYLVESGVESARLFLMQDVATQTDSGGHYDNPMYFQARMVVADEDASFRGNFTVLAPAVDDLGALNGVRYGLEDESNRLNLNALLAADKVGENGGRTLLMALPGMTEEIADAIMDWIDEDDEPREYGCESEYYTQLDPGYDVKNAPLDTVEELMLVRGVTPTLLYGLDTNRNGIVDPFEQNLSMQSQMDAQPTTTAGSEDDDTVESGFGSLDRGWSGYLTLYSAEKNVNAQGDPRIFLNSKNLEQLHKDLTAVFSNDAATFVIAYRMVDSDYTGNETGELANGRELDLTQEPKRSVPSVLELIGKKVQIQLDGQQVILASPFPEEGLGTYINALVDNCTVQEGKVIPGRLNINQAPRTLLLGVPGMTEEMVDRILEERVTALEDDTGVFDHETWLLSALITTLDELKAMSAYICAGGDVFRAQVVGYYESGAASARAEVVFDATGATPQLLFWRDISHLGRGYPLDVLGLQAGDEALGGVGTPSVGGFNQ